MAVEKEQVDQKQQQEPIKEEPPTIQIASKKVKAEKTAVKNERSGAKEMAAVMHAAAATKHAKTTEKQADTSLAQTRLQAISEACKLGMPEEELKGMMQRTLEQLFGPSAQTMEVVHKDNHDPFTENGLKQQPEEEQKVEEEHQDENTAAVLLLKGLSTPTKEKQSEIEAIFMDSEEDE